MKAIVYESVLGFPNSGRTLNHLSAACYRKLLAPEEVLSLILRHLKVLLLGVLGAD